MSSVPDQTREEKKAKQEQDKYERDQRVRCRRGDMCAFYHEKNQKRDPQTSSSVEPPQQVSNLILKNRGLPSGT
jgi:hypothetical protein